MKRSSALPAIARSLKRGFLALSAAVLISTQAAGCGEECKRGSYRCQDGSLAVCTNAVSYGSLDTSVHEWLPLDGGCNSNGNAIYSDCVSREIKFDCNYVGETWQHSGANSREECELFWFSLNLSVCGDHVEYRYPVLEGRQWASTTFKNVKQGLKALFVHLFGESVSRYGSRADVQVDELHPDESQYGHCDTGADHPASFLDDGLIAEATRRNISDDGEVKVNITARAESTFELTRTIAVFCYDRRSIE